MNICVFVPSHINYDGQLTYLDKCLTSLVNQTYKCDIYVAISFELDVYKTLFAQETLSKFASTVKFVISRTQKFQMEHIHTLLLYTKDKNYDLIMFCDDDDTYTNDRVDVFIQCYEYNAKCQSNEMAGVREYINTSDPEHSIPEYWCYAVKPYILQSFFDRCIDHMHLLKHKFADTYLRNYLRRSHKSLSWGAIISDNDNCLYKYNIDNPKSICGKLQNTTYTIEDICNQNILDIINLDIPTYKMHIVCHEDIKALCEKLYI